MILLWFPFICDETTHHRFTVAALSHFSHFLFCTKIYCQISLILSLSWLFDYYNFPYLFDMILWHASNWRVCNSNFHIYLQNDMSTTLIAFIIYSSLAIYWFSFTNVKIRNPNFCRTLPSQFNVRKKRKSSQRKKIISIWFSFNFWRLFWKFHLELRLIPLWCSTENKT